MSSYRVGIVDYQTGNIGSVCRCVEGLDYNTEIISTHNQLLACDCVILPGVGSAEVAAKSLDRLCIREFFENNTDKKLIGICLGMQLLFNSSEESKNGISVPGLSVFNGVVTKSAKPLRFGWFQLLFPVRIRAGGYDDGPYFFNHNYVCEAEQADVVHYYENDGLKCPAIVEKNNIIGLQFHPELSGKTGAQLIKKLCEG